MEKTMLIGAIMSRISALGDAELAGMMGELLVELSKPTDNTTTTPVNPKEGKYVVCVEATTSTGEKIQHPIIGGNIMPSSVDDYKMIVGEDLVKLQRDNQSLKSAIESRYPMVHVRYVPVTDEALASLEKKLKELIDNLSKMLDEAAEAKREAYNLMHVTLSPEDISDDMIADVMRKTIYAGAGINANGEVVDRTPDDKYIEEREIERRNKSEKKNDDYDDKEYEDDDEDDSEWDPDTCDGDCGDCEGRNDCHESTY